MSEDVTFCANDKCPMINCCRNQQNIQNFNILHSFAMFTECEHWGDTADRKGGAE